MVPCARPAEDGARVEFKSCSESPRIEGVRVVALQGLGCRDLVSEGI